MTEEKAHFVSHQAIDIALSNSARIKALEIAVLTLINHTPAAPQAVIHALEMNPADPRDPDHVHYDQMRTRMIETIRTAIIRDDNEQ